MDRPSTATISEAVESLSAFIFHTQEENGEITPEMARLMALAGIKVINVLLAECRYLWNRPDEDGKSRPSILGEQVGSDYASEV